MRAEQFLRDSVGLFANKTALITPERNLSYAEFDFLSDQLAGALQARGVARGDRVLIFMDNCWQAALSLFAIWKAGAVASPLNPSTKAAKLSFILNNCQPRAILSQAKLIGLVQKAAEDYASALAIFSCADTEGSVPDGAISFEASLENQISPAHGGIDIDLALLIYTSGSTGLPKGVMMTHTNVEAAARSVSSYLQNTPDDIILNVLPLSFDYGLYQLIMSVLVGSSLVLEKSFAFPQAILERIREEKVTGFPLVPTMAAMVLRMKSFKPGSCPSLRYITNTAAALPTSHIERLQALFPSAKIFSMYGLTECKRCTYLPPEQLRERPDSVGKAIPNSEAFVLDETGSVCAPGKIGELVIRGPHIMQGYWQNEEATQAMLKPGKDSWEKWLYTGDLFRSDADGYLYFVGRKDDIIKTRGEKVAPKEVELVLLSHGDISEAVVTGISDPILGESIAAMVVVTAQTLTPKQIIEHCRRNLEEFMVPKRIEIRPALPKTSSGKVSRRLARQSLENEEA